ncbi:MAG: PD-(D/E)XK nuclease superfamily protein [Mastigocoleus sp.]
MTMTQGARANKSGGILERHVETTLRTHDYFQLGCRVPRKQQREFMLNSILLPKHYAKQVYIGSGIYQTDIYVDFFVVGLPGMSSGMIIECKWQESEGSVDEKFPYLNLNIQNSYPAPTIIVIGGEGMRDGSVRWLKERVRDNHNLIGVYSLDRFIAWTGKNL